MDTWAAAASVPETLGTLTGYGIGIFGLCGAAAIFIVGLTIRFSIGRGWGHVGLRWIKTTGVLFAATLLVIGLVKIF